MIIKSRNQLVAGGIATRGRRLVILESTNDDWDDDHSTIGVE